MQQIIDTLRFISHEKDSSIVVALQKLSQVQQNKLNTTLSVVAESIDPVKKTPFSKAVTVSKGDIFREILKRIEDMLKKYESTEAIDEWNIAFQFGKNLDEMSEEGIIIYHQHLIGQELVFCKLGLYSKYERGRVYSNIKTKNIGNWVQKCEEKLGKNYIN
jgi:hypothetical protein